MYVNDVEHVVIWFQNYEFCIEIYKKLTLYVIYFKN